MSLHNALDAAPLGHVSAYPEQYDSGQLFPIHRTPQREALGLMAGNELPFIGSDLWQAFEISWLTPSGKPCVRIGRFTLPANSRNLIESKSWKLYLNSFNQSVFDTEDEVVALMKRDLSAAADGDVTVQLHTLDDPALAGGTFTGTCLDDLDVDVSHYAPTPELITVDMAGGEVEETLFSHLLKSNCPVTGQPDWGSVIIHYRGPKIDHAGLLAYLISYRQHQDFHEHCVEHIFVDLLAQARPSSLMVSARYVRRGGLDINPTRATFDYDPKALQALPRLIRQ